MRRVTSLLRSTLLFVCCATFAFADDGLRVMPQQLLALANTWSQSQTIKTGSQFQGLRVSNASNQIASIIGISGANDGGDFQLSNGGTTTVRMSAYPGQINYAPNFEVGGSGATISTGELALAKITASGTAPAAGNGKLALVAGTNSGTCKLIIYAGTSTTPSTILDNIGSGC